MMTKAMKVRRGEERGGADHGWLQTHHSFSFGDYYDPNNMGFRALRVINDDVIQPGKGFGTHGHRDMEIISLVIEGELAHKDSLGHTEVLRPGEVQVMSAGRGIRHSEFNPSDTKRVHLLQIWIQPEKSGLPSAYAQKAFSIEERMNRIQRVAGQASKEDGALKINQDAHVYLSTVEGDASVSHSLAKGRGAWVHLIRGEGVVNGSLLKGGDAVSIEDQGEISLKAKGGIAEFVLFDLK